jgi:hypothetical protein
VNTEATLQTTDDFDDYSPQPKPARGRRWRLALAGACLGVVAVCVFGIMALDMGTYFAPRETGAVVDDFRASVFGSEYRIKTVNWADD